MKKWILFGMICMCYCNMMAQESSNTGIQHAIVHYQLKGSGAGSGKATLFLDDFGAKKALHTKIFSDSNTIQSEYYELSINQQHTSCNMLTGQRLDNETVMDVPTSILLTDFKPEIRASLGYRACGECRVSQKNCFAYCNNSDTICLWNGVVLKLAMHLSLVSIQLEATDIDLAKPIVSVFQLPDFNSTKRTN